VVRHMNKRTPAARLQECAATAVGMAALSGFVAVGACVAASISLWEMSGELRQVHSGSRSSRLRPLLLRLPDPAEQELRCHRTFPPGA